MKKLRHYLIRNGFIKPTSLAETREIFPFPYDVQPRKTEPIWMGRHMEKLTGKYLV